MEQLLARYWPVCFTQTIRYIYVVNVSWDFGARFYLAMGQKLSFYLKSIDFDNFCHICRSYFGSIIISDYIGKSDVDIFGWIIRLWYSLINSRSYDAWNILREYLENIFHWRGDYIMGLESMEQRLKIYDAIGSSGVKVELFVWRILWPNIWPIFPWPIYSKP